VASAYTCSFPTAVASTTSTTATYEALDRLRRAGDDDATREHLRRLGVEAPPYVDDTAPHEPPLRALSLASRKSATLGCAYCYAEGGSFGGPATSMELQTALDSVDLLFGEWKPANGST